MKFDKVVPFTRLLDINDGLCWILPFVCFTNLKILLKWIWRPVMTGAFPDINWWSFVPNFWKPNKDIIKIKKTVLEGRGCQLDQWWGYYVIAGELAAIILEIRGEFVLFIEAAKHIFEGWGGGGTYLAQRGGEHSPRINGVGSTHLRYIYYLVPYTDLGSRGVFQYLTLLLFLIWVD